ncbi:hypothetical protein OBBRIDRAFT_734437 [Obba rivulosa]|uniref:Protein-S-isoprenylcysteine O-methyltransferase n=1 Tax=Obba rivulosa TaxID=1052685 RepID=A0A8E2APV7_9APHY|nr:hypothetical protein OBBRIDRAFT_734437 [Obba rivulosa]
MSLSRGALVCLQAVLYQLASTPPNKTPSSGRYATDEVFLIRIAAKVFLIQQPLVWLCSMADLLLVLAEQSSFPISPLASDWINSTLCAYPTSRSVPLIRTTPLFLLGFSLLVFGALLRLTCFRVLGSFFTFDLAILPAHRLITTGPYAYVRHPAYTGSLFVLMGLGIANLSRGGWVAECVARGSMGAVVRVVGFALWYAWWMSVGVRRAIAEDAALRKIFGAEWDKYAKEVRWWFFPGVL